MDTSYWAAMMNGQQPTLLPPEARMAPQESPLLKALGLVPKKDPLLNARRVELAPVARGSGLTNFDQEKQVDENTDTSKSMTQTNKKLVLDDATLRSLYNRTEQLPIFQEQREGLKKNRDLLAIAAQAPTDVLSGPLAGLLETEFGRKTGGMQANRGPSAMDQQKNILNFADKTADDQSAYSKNLFEAIGKQQGGNQLDSYLSQIVGRNLGENISNAKAEDPRKFDQAAKSGKPVDLSKDVKELGKQRALVSSAMLNTFDRIDQELKDTGGLAGLRNSSKGVEGAGGLNAFIPIGMRDDKGARLYNLAMDLALQKLQMRSGAAASDKEAAKYLKQFGLSPSSGAREMQQGLTKLTDDVHSYLASDEARFRPEVVKTYKQNPGAILSSDLDKYRVGTPMNQKKTKAPARTKSLDQMSDAELAAYEKSLTKGK